MPSPMSADRSSWPSRTHEAVTRMRRRHAARRGLTPADIAADPEYWIAGPGRVLAEATPCGHPGGYRLTDSCPACDADEETHR
ncbi:hypothetical protein FZ103_00190 [Streptomonospora sp. PA3]|uniref:hypothetical protein n=1 Tax=Streptomonospora sp. PA3 TaxID=2607326 RepID=UPI0012DC9473|nr:hypothetical protein [Streptomonospora sp. PA3]MUL39613.1 hypothetical protein [Streptomonospora sp. PA3]